MLPNQMTIVQETWRQVVPIADNAASLFYDRLFEIDPSIRRLFAGVDMESQGRKLVQALATFIDALEHIETLVPKLRSLGQRHVGYGVTDAHYDTVGAALLWTLEKGLGDVWTADAKAAWTAAYTLVADVMRTAASETNRHQVRQLSASA